MAFTVWYADLSMYIPTTEGLVWCAFTITEVLNCTVCILILKTVLFYYFLLQRSIPTPVFKFNFFVLLVCVINEAQVIFKSIMDQFHEHSSIV